MRETDECDMEGFDALDISGQTIALLGDRVWSQEAK